jgi:hypothetical protein
MAVNSSLVLQGLILCGQVLCVEADQLGEKQVQQRPCVRQAVRGDAHIDGHALPAQLAQVEVIGAGGRIDHRVRKDDERSVERGDHAGQRVLGVAQQALQGVHAFV